MSWKPTAWLLVLVFLTGAFIMVFERGSEPSARALPVDVPLLHVSPAAVTRLSITSGGVGVDCVLREGQWFLAKPVEMRADASRVARLIEAIVAIRRQEVVDVERREKRRLTLASFGLETPRARVVVGTELRADELLLGDQAPLGDRVYLRLNGGTDVLGVSGRLSEILPLDAEGLQDKAVFPATVMQACRLEVKHAGGFFQLLLRDGVWRVQQPFDALADGARVEQLLQMLAALVVSGYGDGGSMADPASFGFGADETGLQVSVWPIGKPEPFVLTVGKPRQDNPALLYARVSDAGRVAYVGREVLSLQAVKAESLRDRRLCDADPAVMTAIALRDGDQKLVLEKGETGHWMITEPLRFAANTRAVGALLRAVGALQGDEVRLPGGTNAIPAVVERMACRLAMAAVSGKTATNEIAATVLPATSWSFRFGNPDAAGGAGLVYGEESKTLHSVRAEDLARLWLGTGGGVRASLADPLPYMDCHMLDLNPQQIRKITLSRQGREETVTVNAEGLWAVESPPDGQVAAGVIPSLLELAASLQAERVESLATTNKIAYGLGETAARVTFGVSGGGIQKTLLLGSDNGRNGVFAMVQGQEAVFVLRKPMADVLLRPLVKQP